MTEKQLLKQILRNQVYLAHIAKATALDNRIGVDFNFNELKRQTEDLIGPINPGDLRWDGSVR